MSIRKRISRYATEDKTQRTRTRGNFDAGSNTVDSAVATANLMTILDPQEIGDNEVALIADVTGSSNALVENLADLVEQSNEADIAGVPEGEIVTEFSRKAREVVAKFGDGNTRRRRSRNFDSATGDAITDAAAIVSMLDDDAIDMLPAAEIAGTICDATGAPVEAVTAIVEIAQDNFSAGKKFGYQEARKLDRTKFSRLHFANAPVANPTLPPVPTEDPMKETGSVNPDTLVPHSAQDNPVVEGAELSTPAIAQDPALAANDPEGGDSMSNAGDAGQAMTIQQELATVQAVGDVPNNFHNTKKDDFSMLRSLLGDKYIAN